MRLTLQVMIGHFQRVQESQGVSQARYQQGSGSSDGFPPASLFFLIMSAPLDELLGPPWDLLQVK